MNKILVLESSILKEHSSSTTLSKKLLEIWQTRHGSDGVTHRNLADSPLPLLSNEVFQSFTAPIETLSEKQKGYRALSDSLIDEIKAHDVLVINAPMYNFSIPTQLKAYFDLIARAGITFRYTENGAEGLVTGKKAYIIVTSGGMHQGQQSDLVTPYLSLFLGFIGITDIEFIYQGGIAFGPEMAEKTRNDAIEQIKAAI